MPAPRAFPPPPLAGPLPLHVLTSVHVPVPGLHLPHLPHVVADLEELARRVDGVADEVRRTQERLRRHAAAVEWESAAATAYRDHAEAHAAGLARCALLADDVAVDLRHHAHVVHERAEEVRRAAEAVRDGVRDAVGAVLGELR